MRPWFQKRDPATDEPYPADRADLLDAYKDGRKDERQRVERDLGEHRPGESDVKGAYERGRRDERARRHGSPVASLVVLLAAAAGVGVLFLAAREGSFSAGGQVVDRNITAAADTARAPVNRAADSAGTALENAGQTLKEKAGDTRR